jgi:alpha-mannosidase
VKPSFAYDGSRKGERRESGVRHVHDVTGRIRQRVERALSERIAPGVRRARQPLDVSVHDLPGEPVAAPEAIAADYRPARVGDPWGPPWSTSWFHLTGGVPAEWAGGRVELRVDLGFTGGPGFQAEGLLYTPDGVPLQGVEPDHTLMLVAEAARGGEPVDYYVEAAANPPVIEHAFRPTDLGDRDGAPTEPLYRLAAAELVLVDEEVRQLGYDVEVLLGLATSLPGNSARGRQILHALNAAVDTLDGGGVAERAREVRDMLAPLLKAPADHDAHRVSAVGHAHIDSAWLWPLRETVRKCARTFSNVVSLAESHPELRFACSQAQQYAWMKEHHPAVFARVRDAVAAGTFVPVGGMWVESDTNLPGGEALARQFVHGQRFFRDEFGVRCREVWLPDSFGYSGALPQIARLAGMDWALTEKMAYNEFNAFPHSTFWWEGIDGTRLFAHYPPVQNYNSLLTAEELAHAADTFAEKGRATRSLVPFGHGDGGGGPTRQMLEYARRKQDLAGSPSVTIETPAEFFTAAQQEYPDAPVWVGEIYLESHRGTYTSQAAMKQGNRRAEHLLREVELWAATATARTGTPYPYEDLDRIWKTVLLHQFHDILPGSSIAWVHREAAETYHRIIAELTELRTRAQRELAGEGDRDLVFNATPQAWNGVSALGAAPAATGDRPATSAADGSGFVLDNGLVRVRVDERGLVVSVRDLVADREVLPPGTVANLPQLHADRPVKFDAWDVDDFYRDLVTDLTGATTVRRLEGDAAVEVVREFGASRLVQRVRLTPGSRTVEFEAEVDWQESERFLKVAFPVDVHTGQATAEIQYGHLSRPTHSNTSWDAARFEICAHRFLHVGDAAYGVALVNDSTYGHDVTRHERPGGGTYSTVRLSLLRSPSFPDPGTDRGGHVLRYGLVCGADIGAAVREGYRMNLPPRVVRGGADVAPLVSVDNDAVVVEAVKLADDRSGDLVVRLYESLGGAARVRLSADGNGSVTETNLLEEPIPGGRGFAAGDPVELTLRAFEIVTLRWAAAS